MDWGGRDPSGHDAPLSENGDISYPQVLPGAFNPAECAAIAALGETRVKAAASVDGRSDLASRDYRVSDIAWIEPAADSHWLYHRLGMLFRRVNETYGFEIWPGLSRRCSSPATGRASISAGTPTSAAIQLRCANFRSRFN